MTDTFEDRVAATLVAMRNWCEENGVVPNGYGAVDERTAERILGYAPRTLAKQHELGGCEIPCRRLGNRRWYTLEDMAREVERGYLAQ
ncbi:hypothetical protein V8Z80_04850 [Orrella sp. JC864]|uniref:hypothetical protein n=1 Tax=Orrella sp. JC864 TaxID=3120298 RepID=UPI003008DBBE